MSMMNCLLCKADGFLRVGTVHVPGYEFDVCQTHWKENADGWTNHYEWIILEHLSTNKTSVPRKGKKGFLPRDYP
jgi:hypothetical protein